MVLLQILVLAAVQGVTEFLPISSQAHLILVDEMTGWPDSGLKIRVAVHVGSLGAVLLYFRSDIWAVIVGVFHLFLGRTTENARLAMHLIIASAPVIATAAVIVILGVEDYLTDLTIIAWTMIGFGALLWLADRGGMTVRRLEHMRFGGAVAIGLA